jgi:hypothetical protein
VILPPQGPSFGPAMKLSSDIESPVETFPMFVLLSILSREQDAPAGPSTCRPDRRKRLYDQADLFAVEALCAIHVGTEIATTSSRKPIRLRLLLSGGLFGWFVISRTLPGGSLAYCHVGKVEYAPAERLRVHEFQGFPIAVVLEQALAAA